MGRASGNYPRDRDRDSRDRDRRRERSRSRDRSRDRGRHDKDHRRDRSPGRDRPRHYDRDRHRDRSRSRGRREGGGVSGDHGRRSQPRDGRGGREGDALPTSFSGRDDREGKGLRDDDTSTSLESRGRAKFTEAGAEPLDEFAPAELLNRLEKLEVKRDFDRLKRFVDEVASLLHNDQDNRELVQLHQQATALLQQLESATPAAAEVPSPTPSGSAPDALQAPAGSAATKAEDESDEEWKKPPVRWLATVVSFNVKKGFGFLRPDDESVVPAGQDIFVHKAAVQVQGPGQTVLAEGQRVSFVLKEEPGNGRLCALDVRDPDGNAIVQEVNQSTLDLRSHTETWRGLKDQQEDRWTGPEDMGDMGQYFGIFDGHGGIFTSEYLARNMHKAILSRKKGLSNFQNNEASVRRLVQDTFSLTDKELMKLPAYAKARDGSTALVVMISGSDQPVAGKPGNIRVMVANVGDSRAVMCRSGRGIRLSEDHKPNRGDEERRVKSAGGHVVCIGGIHRVTTAAGAGAGVNLKEHQYLAVSRSFGDSELKSPNALVTCAPEIKAFDVTAQDSFIVMACDGIWDVLDDQAVCEIAGEHFGRPKDAAASVVRAAYQRGSGDNLTATVIEFGWVTPEQFKAHLEQYVEEQEQGKDEDLDMFGD